jgi:hypothetical protein
LESSENRSDVGAHAHTYSDKGICQTCGRSRTAIDHFGWACTSEAESNSSFSATVRPAAASVQQSAGDDVLRLQAEVERLRAILSRIVSRYERERGGRHDSGVAVMLAWAMKSDAEEALN